MGEPNRLQRALAALAGEDEPRAIVRPGEQGGGYGTDPAEAERLRRLVLERSFAESRARARDAQHQQDLAIPSANMVAAQALEVARRKAFHQAVLDQARTQQPGDRPLSSNPLMGHYQTGNRRRRIAAETDLTQKVKPAQTPAPTNGPSPARRAAMKQWDNVDQGLQPVGEVPPEVQRARDDAARHRFVSAYKGRT